MEQQLINKEKLASEPKVKDHFMMKICGAHMDRVRWRVGCNMVDYWEPELNRLKIEWTHIRTGLAQPRANRDSSSARLGSTNASS